MSKNTLDLTGRAQFNIRLNARSNNLLQFKQYSDAKQTVPQNFPAGVWQMKIRKAYDKQLVQTIANTQFTATANELTIRVIADAELVESEGYEFEIKLTLPDGTELYPFVGQIKIEEIF